MRVILLLCIMLLTCSCYSIQNVTPLLYRSPQPTPEQLDIWLTQYSIQTVINLRGFHPSEEWWRIRTLYVDIILIM